MSEAIFTYEPETRPDCGRFDRALLLDLYRQMVLIRSFEKKVRLLFLEGIMPGTIHQYDGQEACGVGVCSVLGSNDVVTSTHRPHGHAIARGLPVTDLMSELFGKVDGCCHGKGGSMHLGDLSRGMLPAIALVGSSIPLAAGIALAFKLRGEARVAVSFFGDGAVSEGAFHEGVNLASVWSLPVVFVCENNGYGASTPVRQVMRAENVADRASAYGLSGRIVDGNDVLAVREAAEQAVDQARRGQGPAFLELKTYRACGHSRRDPCHYQPDEEKKWWAQRDPIVRFRSALLEAGKATEEDLEAVNAEVERDINGAAEHAQAAESPAPTDALDDVWG